MQTDVEKQMEARMREMRERKAAEKRAERDRLNAQAQAARQAFGYSDVPPVVASEPSQAVPQAVEQSVRQDNAQEQVSDTPKQEEPVKSEPVRTETAPKEEHADAHEQTTADTAQPEPVPAPQEPVAEKPAEKPVVPDSPKPQPVQYRSTSIPQNNVRAVSRETDELLSDPVDVKQVRNVYAVAVEIAQREFPGATMGDAMSACIIAHSDYRPKVPKDLQRMIDNCPSETPLAEMSAQIEQLENRLASMENMVRIMLSGMQELNLGVSYLIADRKLLTKDDVNFSAGAMGVNLLEPCVEDMMDRVHQQTRQYVTSKRVRDGRRTSPPK